MMPTKYFDSKVEKLTMDSVLSLGDGGWIHPDEESDFLVNNELEYSDIQLTSIRQPSPPPVLAKISDPRYGTSELAQDGLCFTNSYHDLHIVSL